MRKEERMKLSKRVTVIEPSLTRELYNKAQGYTDVIDLTLGDPDLKPSEVIRNAACEAVQTGKTRYSANAGLLDLRKTISKQIEKEYKVSVDPYAEITTTVGGMEALYLALATIIDEGDEVIIPAPYYVNYVQMVRMCGGIPVIINTKEEDNFSISIEQISEHISEKTVAIIINTPSNPTGQVLADNLLSELAEIVKEKKLIVIADEVYSSLIYDGKQHYSIFNKSGMRDHVILVDSISKRFAMTGYRLGYAVGPKEIIGGMTTMQENVAACAPLPSQYAGIAAYSLCYDDKSIHDIFEERRNYIYKAINSIEGLHANKPAATFYLFVNISSTGMDSLSFAEKLLTSVHVAVAPGITYGKDYDNFIRIAFTLDVSKLKEAVLRIQHFMEELNNSSNVK